MQDYKFILEDFQTSIKSNDLPLLRLGYAELKTQITFDLLRLAPTESVEDFQKRILPCFPIFEKSFSDHEEYTEVLKEKRFEYVNWLVKIFQEKIDKAEIRELDNEEKKYVYPAIEAWQVSCVTASELDYKIFLDLRTKSNLSWVKRETIKFLDLILGEDWNDYTVYRLQRDHSWCSVNYSDYSPQELTTYFILHNSGKEIWILFNNVFWN